MDRTIYDGLKRQASELQKQFDRAREIREDDARQFEQRQKADRALLADLDHRISAIETVLGQYPWFESENGDVATAVKADANELVRDYYGGSAKQYTGPQAQGDGDPGYPNAGYPATNPVPNFVDAPGAGPLLDGSLVIELRRVQ